MAISMSGTTIDTDQRDELRSSTVDTSITSGGTQANTTELSAWQNVANGIGGIFDTTFYETETTGATLAGVTASFATNVCSQIDTYKSTVQGWLDGLQDANSSVAFKGEGIQAALTTFIDSVREVAGSYLNKLSVAEQQIINSVQTAYQTQDTDLSGDMGADSTSLTNTSVQ